VIRPRLPIANGITPASSQETYKYFFSREQVPVVRGKTPITVIRTRHITQEDVRTFHRLIGFDEGESNRNDSRH